MDTQRTLDAARLRVSLEFPYLSHAVWALRGPVMVRGLMLQAGGAIGVDQYWRLYMDPDMTWTISQLATALRHEVWHCLRDHAGRKKNRCARRWNVSCFPAGMLLGDGVPIETAAISTLCASGTTWLTSLSREYAGDIVTLRCGGRTLSATPEHPVRIVRRAKKGYPIKLCHPAWGPISSVRVGDYLVTPKLPGTDKRTDIDLEPFMLSGTDTKGRKTFRNRVILKKFPLNEDTAWLLGLYTAEGSGSVLNLPDRGRKLDAAKRVVEIMHSLGYSGLVSKDNGKRMLRVYVGGTVLERAFRCWCGRGSHNKRIPDFVLCHENVSLLLAYIHGYATGDGCTYDTASVERISTATASSTLAAQLPLALARLDTGCTVRTQTQKPRSINGKAMPTGQALHTCSWSWSVGVTERYMNGHQILSHSESYRSIDEGVIYPVRKISTQRFSGTVYNLSTEDHTYIASGFLVHNCDLEINSDMQAERGVAVAGRSSSAPDWPYEGVFPSTFGLEEHLIAEEYYALIPKHDHPQQDSGGNGDESGDSSTSGQSNSSQSAPASQRQQSDCIGCGRCSGAPSPGGSNSDGVPRVWEQGADGKIREVTGAEADAIRQSVAEQIRSQAEKGQGSIPVGAMRWAEERLTPPKVPWQQVLRGAVRAVVAQLAGMVDYSRQRPSRRQAVSQSEVMLPTLVRPTPKVAVVIDTSGSMSDEQLRLAVSEVQGVITASGSEEVAVLSCDAVAYAPKKVVSARSVTLQGGGGTDMGVGIQACMKLRPRPDVVIVITDGLTGWDVDPPPFRTVVCLVGDHAPFDTCPSWAKVVEVDS